MTEADSWARGVERGKREEASVFSHTVQFYERDDFLCEAIAAHFKAGMAAGEAFVMFATADHVKGVMDNLQTECFDVEGLRAIGKLNVFDAQESLSAFMVDGFPSRDRFTRHVAGLLDKVRKVSRNGRVRAYGEMVDILWQQQNAEGALELERLWDEVGQTVSVSLLCGYSLQACGRRGHEQSFFRICDAHEHVAPTQLFPRNEGSEASQRTLTWLQQRTHALETEVARRANLESELRSALGERDRLASELRRRHEDLAGAVHFDDMFVGILGHELRNPLAAISTAASLIKRRAVADEISEPTRRILRNATRVARLVDQLLDITRIRLGREIRVDRVPTNLSNVCAVVLDEATAAGQTEKTSLEAHGDTTGSWDGDRLLQMLSLLVGGASRQGASAQQVDIRIDGTSTDMVTINIQCSGVVPSGALRGLCAPFLSGLRETQELLINLGLGLFVSRLILLAHSATIVATSSDGDGTHFAIRLPRALPNVEPPGDKTW